MTDIVKVALLTSIAPTITSIASLCASLRNHEKLQTIEKATNGMNEKLQQAAKAEGILEEKQRSENQKHEPRPI